MKPSIQWPPLVALSLLTIGCDSPKSSNSPASSSATATSTAAATAPVASAKPMKAKLPPEARRNSAPKGIADSALAVGTEAPALVNIASTMGAWSRGEKTAVVVFYRGHW